MCLVYAMCAIWCGGWLTNWVGRKSWEISLTTFFARALPVSSSSGFSLIVPLVLLPRSTTQHIYIDGTTSGPRSVDRKGVKGLGASLRIYTTYFLLPIFFFFFFHYLVLLSVGQATYLRFVAQANHEVDDRRGEWGPPSSRKEGTANEEPAETRGRKKVSAC